MILGPDVKKKSDNKVASFEVAQFIDQCTTFWSSHADEFNTTGLTRMYTRKRFSYPTGQHAKYAGMIMKPKFSEPYFKAN